MATYHTVAWYDMLTPSVTTAPCGSPRPAGPVSTQLRHRDYYRTLAAAGRRTPSARGRPTGTSGCGASTRTSGSPSTSAWPSRAKAPAALEIAAPLWNFWFAGFLREGHRYLSLAIDAAPEQTPTRALGIWAGRYLAMFLGEAEQSTRLLAECAELAERYDDERLRARIAEVSGQALIYQGDLPVPSPVLERGLAGYRAVEDLLGEFDIADLVVRGNLLPGRSAGRGVQPAGATSWPTSRRCGLVEGLRAVECRASSQWRDHDQFERGDALVPGRRSGCGSR